MATSESRSKRQRKIGHCDAKRRKLDITPGVNCRGVIVTANHAGRSHEAAREVIKLLEQILEEDFEYEPCIERSEDGRVINNSKTAAFWGHQLLKNVEFVKFADKVKVLPSVLVARLFERLLAQNSDRPRHDSKLPSVRFATKIIPCDITSTPYMNTLTRLAKILVRRHFPEAAVEDEGLESTDRSEDSVATVPKGGTWKVEWSNRSMRTLEKDVVCDLFASLIRKPKVEGEQEPPYKVDLTDPAYTIIVEVNPLMCGLSLLPSFNRYLKCNVFRLTHPELESAAATVAAGEVSKADGEVASSPEEVLEKDAENSNVESNTVA